MGRTWTPARRALAARPYIISPHPSLGGLILVEDFVSEGEEASLLRWLDAQKPGWVLRHFNGPALGMRWGVRTDLRLRVLEVGEAMPETLLSLTRRMRSLPLPSPSPLGGFEANEANALKYVKREGHYLGAHCDDRQGGSVKGEGMRRSVCMCACVCA